MFLPLPLPLIFLPLPLPSTLLKNIIFIVFALAPISPMLCHFFCPCPCPLFHLWKSEIEGKGKGKKKWHNMGEMGARAKTRAKSQTTRMPMTAVRNDLRSSRWWLRIILEKKITTWMVLEGTHLHRKDPTGCLSRLDTPCASWRGDRDIQCPLRMFCLPSETAEVRQTILL